MPVAGLTTGGRLNDSRSPQSFNPADLRAPVAPHGADTPNPMTRFLPLLGALALTLVVLVGCSETTTGNDPGGEQPASRRSMLVGKTWQTYIYLENGNNMHPGASVPEWIVFDNAGTYRRYSALYMESTGNWELVESDTKLVLDKGSGFEASWILEVVSNNILVMNIANHDNVALTNWYLDRPLTTLAVDKSMFAAKPWRIELAIFDGNDVTSDAAGTTEFKTDGTYATLFTSGATKSGKWEFGPANDEVTLDKGNSIKEKTWRIIELTSNRLDMVVGDDRTLSFITPVQRVGGRNDLLTAAGTWRVDSVKINNAVTTLITSAPSTIKYNANGSFVEVRRNGLTYRSIWELANNATAITAGLRQWDIVELTSSTLRMRRLYRAERFGVLEVIASRQ